MLQSAKDYLNKLFHMLFFLLTQQLGSRTNHFERFFIVQI